MRRGLSDLLESLKAAGLTELPPGDPDARIWDETPAVSALVNGGNSQNSEPEMNEHREEDSKKMPRAKKIDRAAALLELANEVAQCKLCKELATTRTQTVFGNGDPASSLVFLGEAPGADEDREGLPFVGRAGRLLDDIITKGMGLKRENVYVCNILRCRPPGNRNPHPEEAANCRKFLDATLEIINPKFICCLGAVAAQNFLGTTEPIGSLRGRVLDYKGIKVVCTYHPAYLLRSPNMKGKTWEDIQLLLKEMGLPVPRKGEV